MTKGNARTARLAVQMDVLLVITVIAVLTRNVRPMHVAFGSIVIAA
jgi:predicted histidine transporter YuiF (NhaC family)